MTTTIQTVPTFAPAQVQPPRTLAQGQTVYGSLQFDSVWKLRLPGGLLLPIDPLDEEDFGLTSKDAGTVCTAQVDTHTWHTVNLGMTGLKARDDEELIACIAQMTCPIDVREYLGVEISQVLRYWETETGWHVVANCKPIDWLAKQIGYTWVRYASQTPYGYESHNVESRTDELDKLTQTMMNTIH